MHGVDFGLTETPSSRHTVVEQIALRLGAKCDWTKAESPYQSMRTEGHTLPAGWHLSDKTQKSCQLLAVQLVAQRRACPLSTLRPQIPFRHREIVTCDSNPHSKVARLIAVKKILRCAA